MGARVSLPAGRVERQDAARFAYHFHRGTCLLDRELGKLTHHADIATLLIFFLPSAPSSLSSADWASPSTAFARTAGPTPASASAHAAAPATAASALPCPSRGPCRLAHFLSRVVAFILVLCPDTCQVWSSSQGGCGLWRSGR